MENKWWKHAHSWHGGGGGNLYGLGVIGALFYFLPNAIGLQDLIIGLIKSFAWPAFLVFKALEFLKV